MANVRDRIVEAIRQCIRQGQTVRLDGLGRLRPSAPGRLEFLPELQPRIFIAYMDEDRSLAQRLSEDLSRHGFDPWLDVDRLLPGQNWIRAIEREIEAADFFIPCFSRHATARRSIFHHELRCALRLRLQTPLDDAFIFPVRLETCRIPETVAREIQYVDLFPDWQTGVGRLVKALEKEAAGRRARREKDNLHEEGLED
jgi:hypothetical protein